MCNNSLSMQSNSLKNQLNCSGTFYRKLQNLMVFKTIAVFRFKIDLKINYIRHENWQVPVAHQNFINF